jgi:hypothetical protein
MFRTRRVNLGIQTLEPSLFSNPAIKVKELAQALE